MSCAKEREVLSNVIEIYKDMPYLWNKTHKDYLNKKVRDDGFKVLLQIYKNFDEKSTIKLLKRKLENMRTSYARELRKISLSKHTGAGAADVYKPSLWYFETLSFLGTRTESCRPALDSFEDENLSSTDEDLTASTSKNSGTKKKNIQTKLLERQEKFFQSAEEMINKKEEEWEVLGRAIGYQMKDLNQRQLNICQKIVSDAIFYAKFNRLSEDSHIVLSKELTSNNNFIHDQCSSPALSSYSPPLLPSHSVHHFLQQSPSHQMPHLLNTQQQLHSTLLSPQSPSPSITTSPSHPSSSNYQNLSTSSSSLQPSSSQLASSNSKPLPISSHVKSSNLQHFSTSTLYPSTNLSSKSPPPQPTDFEQPLSLNNFSSVQLSNLQHFSTSTLYPSTNLSSKSPPPQPTDYEHQLSPNHFSSSNSQQAKHFSNNLSSPINIKNLPTSKKIVIIPKDLKNCCPGGDNSHKTSLPNKKYIIFKLPPKNS